MSTRSVTYTINKPDGSAWANTLLKFGLTPGSYTDEAVYPSATVIGVTDEEGEGSVTLWVNEEGESASEYTLTYQNGETASFTVPAGASAIDLTVLLALGVVEGSAQYSTLVTYILSLWQGTWDIATAYSEGQQVEHEGSAYIAIADTTAGQEPGVHASWEVFASQGDTGATGATGPQGAQGAAGAAPDYTVTLNPQTGTTYTLALTDVRRLVTLSNALGIVLTVPANTTIAWPVGEAVSIQAIGAGQVTVTPAGGVTVNGTGTKLRRQWSAGVLLKTATDVWTLIGDLG